MLMQLLYHSIWIGSRLKTAETWAKAISQPQMQLCVGPFNKEDVGWASRVELKPALSIGIALLKCFADFLFFLINYY